MKTLFIVKQRSEYYGTNNSTGLLNSTKFIVDELRAAGRHAYVEEVVDHNDINRVVTKYKPSTVIVEAFWVTPAKFKELMAIHPAVKWFVRNHSKADFASQEGIIYEWTIAYEKLGVRVGYNRWSAKQCADLGLNSPFGFQPALYFPNIYHLENDRYRERHNVRRLTDNVVNIGCFGAIRPLKNQTQQFLAAVGYAHKNNKYLKFYINTARAETGGAPVLKTLRAIGAELKNSGKGELIEIAWEKHEDFLETISKMDLVMQVSFSETFNIVAADAVTNNIPVLVSEEVFWASSDSLFDKRHYATVAPANVEGMVACLENLLGNDSLRNHVLNAQFNGIMDFNHGSLIHWENFLKNV